ncbi:MAG: isoprenyl transferase [Erysipelotrichaceae bacterium]|nr:isoprenyl transferase [Erysipelotrichaceae bacterium]
MTYVPKHVAIIMDGNGRWAAKQKKPRTYGHYQGTENVRNIAIKANDLGVEVLTLYAFSTENWKRPEEEVSYLMSLPAVFITKFLAELMEKGIKIDAIGDLYGLPEKTRKVLQEAIDKTADNRNMTLVFAINYGGRAEIVEAVNKYAQDYKDGKADYPVSEDAFEQYLATGKYPPLDLLIRTSLDYRISNFLLWQVSYAEMYFVDKYWPEFTPEDFEEAITSFSSRQRRFGGLK